MKKHLLGLLVFLPLVAPAQTPVPFTVKGKIGQLNAPAKIYLVRGLAAVDSATLKNGAFEFKGTTDVPRSADLVLKRDGKWGSGMYGTKDATRIYLEPGPVVLSSPDLLRNATVKGGPVTADDQRLQASLKPLSDKMTLLGAQAQKASADEQKTPEFQARRQAQFDDFSKEFAQAFRTFIKANPTSWVSLDVLSSLSMFESPQYAVMGPLYEAFSPALKNSQQGREYGELMQGLKAVAVGAQAPAFSQKTPEGKVVSLADYRGKYVLVDFWASWCGPCRQETPAVMKVYNEYKGRNFDILGVSLDNEKGREKWVKAIQDDKMAWTQVSDLRGYENEAAQLYRVRAIPQNFLIDPNGKIVAFNLKGEALRAALAQYLK